MLCLAHNRYALLRTWLATSDLNLNLILQKAIQTAENYLLVIKIYVWHPHFFGVDVYLIHSLEN